ncbi:MAG TPA: crosslink repair DNA glycosylase YcaQ family protein [Kribbella sp.]|uniref:DNA glycosylase AlkZ-like family protein n=1 Tax=Kribbella sp. TaxID=1871183 RepID=UPI002D790C9B|nr:crosslink repair DNA glycosylase YcaQ family protein [Kribbella sp.]HET6292758.1 crosslink repair DNA glycosylase YcaQ family protein [Kribbella sp.]
MALSLSVSYEQAVQHRLVVNRLAERLPAGSYVQAARFGLQDTAPRDALIGLHARVEDCEPSAWQAPGLIQTYSPRAAVYVLPAEDFGVFTIGRMPLDEGQRRAIDQLAAEICRDLAGTERRGGRHELRGVCASGRLALRWTTSALYFREVPRPEIDFVEAHKELCRRHLQAFGPTTAEAFAWWSGLSRADAKEVWGLLAPELLSVDLEGRPASILAADEATLRIAPAMQGARFLVASDLRLFGQDRHGLFIGPGQKQLIHLHDWFHPHGLMLDGKIVGTWGRRGGRVDVKVAGPLSPETRAAVEAEALSIPIPNATMSIDIAECQ